MEPSFGSKELSAGRFILLRKLSPTIPSVRMHCQRSSTLPATSSGSRGFPPFFAADFIPAHRIAFQSVSGLSRRRYLARTWKAACVSTKCIKMSQSQESGASASHNWWEFCPFFRLEPVWFRSMVVVVVCFMIVMTFSSDERPATLPMRVVVVTHTGSWKMATLPGAECSVPLWVADVKRGARSGKGD